MTRSGLDQDPKSERGRYLFGLCPVKQGPKRQGRPNPPGRRQLVARGRAHSAVATAAGMAQATEVSTEMPTAKVAATSPVPATTRAAPSTAKVAAVAARNQSASSHPKGRAMSVWHHDGARPTITKRATESIPTELTHVC
jgi:hypothetical protein